ncbi:30S ribosomal protein S16 [Sneathia sanguinegens]|uniref:Small ribosomal subunit protein bS16 n=1 Tax=Sneathia sanguinegens TaxID=40543 RepID=A0ABT7HMK4_9FUSO|nr:30S ribosomal protein S16 [Sneathia sanguinegens]MDK9581100.1 30S ribosomal protein S16 [Sneathia sanguinegens]
MLKLRLTRLGRRKQPVYRIVAMEALGKRDGKAVSYIGTFNPLVEENQIKLNEEEVLKFLKNGAQPTETVKSLLVKSGTWAKFEESKKNK